MDLTLLLLCGVALLAGKCQSATGYMNNTKVTDSGGYNDPWDIMPAFTEPYTRDSYAAAVSRFDDNYLQLNDDYLQFNPDYPRQKAETPASYSNECFI
ncbi:hypothetical protein C0Q70_12974 [Pomacea canaliculata]|uniref:Uncharacterized protein n=1 Tax=Pomacea canaliculata TaxID=400727 RepID=A0A2T7P316_POMCA|nr:hypothetical protein C0Q70_12974 [Pomacea canaliculata]